ncbi:sugar phosphate nucleotidyltransferase [Picrophilus oshimae]|uniref:UTP--glucose-1-phosphate uridylyltransferase n=1 Tax=Picrophilus torridus (strain ATCC 700027 / DSM 9790 / JCM 10055 / NBRC 100828 / KAW 2/3) TaxID=1122961 RepID=A0A8G2L8C2_PICTO|nr:sugar phosphate nucleotidyltransferase [Picrophilus oshimae]SMD31289.1 glucose-1-phosphate thymidylyltransferase [Picrophilus oshimae DSM 9789]
MDALITAAGLGTRAKLPRNMRKEMLPVYSFRDNDVVLRPIIDEIMHSLDLNARVKKFYLVLNKNDSYTADYVRSLDYKTEIIYQEKPLGYGNAVRLAEPYLKGFFILNAGDGLIIKDQLLAGAVKMHLDCRCQVLALMPVKNPENYGIAVIKNNNVITCIEKPKNYIGRNAMTAFYILNSKIFEFIEDSNVTSAIDKTIKTGIETRYIKIKRNDWISVGTSESYYRILERTYKNIMTSRMSSA